MEIEGCRVIFTPGGPSPIQIGGGLEILVENCRFWKTNEARRWWQWWKPKFVLMD